MTFEAELAALVEKHVVERARDGYNGPLTPFAEFLGCAHERLSPERVEYIENNPPQPSPEHEPLVLAALLQALRAVYPSCEKGLYDVLPILDGLCRNQRWKVCLESLTDAYAFAALVVHFVVAGNMEFDLLERSRLFESWPPGMDSATMAAKPTTLRAIVNAMFGSAWLDIRFSAESYSALYLADIIVEERPPFAPGVLPAHLEQTAVPLPGLE